MKKRTSKTIRMLVSFLLLFSLMPAGGLSAAPEQQLAENFEGMAAGTTFSTGSGVWRTNTSQADWQVVDEGGDQAVRLSSTGTSSAAFLYHEPTDWTDFTYTARVKAEHNNRVGIVGRFLNGNNYYLLSLNGGNKLELRMKSAATGSSVSTLEDASFTYSTGEYYTLTLQIRGDQLTGSVEGGPTIAATDTSLAGPGKLGFYSTSNTTVYFDDVNATDGLGGDPGEDPGSGDPGDGEDPGDGGDPGDGAIPNKLDIVEVTASGHDGNFPENVLVDDLTTRWSAQSPLVDGVPQGQWLQFNLGTKKLVSYVGLAFHNGNSRSAIFDIEVSDDGESWTEVYSGQASGDTLGLQAFDFDDVEAKFVRYIGYGNTNLNYWNSITVAHLYGPSSTGAVVLAELVPPEPEEREDVPPYTVPGMYEADGTPHAIHTPNPVTGTTYDVTEHGAVPDDGLDDAPAINALIEAAQPGDEIYLPNGAYDLIGTMANDGTSHLPLKSGVNIRGESEEGTILRSHFDRGTSNSKVMRSYAQHDIVISDLTVTSTFSGAYSTNHNQNNPERSGPEYGIYIDEGLTKPSYNITIERVTLEKFQKMGIRISKSRDIVVRAATFQNMTDVGGGGAGYGVSIQGIPKTDRLGYANDTRHNLVEDSTFKGPYMRHGVIIQYYAHNNEVRNNVMTDSKLDAIDLHGEDEYLNKIYGNTISGVLTGAGIALGNTGGTAPSNHDKSGPFNHIYNNTITNSREGIKVHMGSPDTLIEGNTISGITEPSSSRGILIQNGPRTIIKNNIITGNTAANFWGILLETDPGDPNAPRDGNGNIVGAGVPENVQIIGNTITGNSNGVRIDAGIGTVVSGNTISGNLGVDFVDNTAGEPEPEPETVRIEPSKDAVIDIERPDTNYGIADQEKLDNNASDRNWYRLFNVKRSADGTTGRMAYIQYDVEEAGETGEATLELVGRTGSNTTEVTLGVYGIVDDNWDENTITWANSPNHAAGLVDVTGVGETAFLLGTFTINSAENTRYSVDVTEFVKQQADGKATFLLADTIGQNGNVNILSREDANPALRPQLTITKSDEGEPPALPLAIGTVQWMNGHNEAVETLAPGGLLKMQATVRNVSSTGQQGVFIAALYNAQDAVVRIAFAGTTIGAAGTTSVGAGFDLPADVSGHTVKLFIWDSLEGMQPLADPIIFPE